MIHVTTRCLVSVCFSTSHTSHSHFHCLGPKERKLEIGEDVYIYGVSVRDFKNGDCHFWKSVSLRELQDYSIYMSGFMDEEMKAKKVDVPWPRPLKGG